jgi:hypothetical protein
MVLNEASPHVAQNQINYSMLNFAVGARGFSLQRRPDIDVIKNMT